MSAIAIVFCSVIAFVGINHKDNVSLGDLAGSNSSNEQVVDTNVVDTNINKVVEKPATYTYAPGEVMLKKGGSDLNFYYTPDTNAREDEETITPTVTAYEYIFENTMNRASAVNLKEIDTTDVNVSYAWSTSRLDTTQSITTYTNYSLQKMENKGDRAYIYIFVSPTNEKIPTTFTSSIVWWYGVPYEMPIVNNVTNEIEYQTVVDGQKIDKNTLTQPESFTKTENGTEVTYYFDAWFLDKEFTQLVEEDEVKTGRTIYARYHNITPNTTEYIHYVDGEYVFSNDDYFYGSWWGSGYDYFYDTGITNIVIPTIYNDGTNGEAKVTA
ncbi:MAG: hypothetical protein IJ458_00065, partial [Clostridia bacterium]|nr:hypothetical protein [Clostridia bacterium]